MELATTLAPGLYPAGTLDRIPVGEGCRIVIGDEEIAVFRTREGGIHAVQANCPHLGGDLADGIVGAGKVSCPLHGHAFELATGAPVKNPCTALRTYPVEVSASGELTIRIGVVE